MDTSLGLKIYCATPTKRGSGTFYVSFQTSGRSAPSLLYESSPGPSPHSFLSFTAMTYLAVARQFTPVAQAKGPFIQAIFVAQLNAIFVALKLQPAEIFSRF